jgi:prefoldin alpha subunit
MEEKMDINQQELQERYMEFQLLQRQIGELQKQAQLFAQQLAELDASIQSLDELKSIKKGTEILVPIHPGIFAKAQIMDTSELTINAGSGVAMGKSVEDTKNMLKEQQNEIESYRIQLIDQLQKHLSAAQKAEKALMAMTHGFC